jgi:serine/threonine-protein kinase
MGYAVVGFFLVYTPLWGAAFAFAFSVTAAGVRVWARIVPLAWIEAWAWAWAWFVFEAFAGVVGGSVVWALAGAALGVVVGVVVWPWALAGAFAGAVSGAMSEAANELRKSFCKYHTFLILALTSLSGLGLGRLLSRVFL